MAAQNHAPRAQFETPRTPIRAAASDGVDSGAASAARFWPTMLLVVLCQVADLVTFNLAVDMHGPGGELGPLGLVYRAGGFWAVAAVKLGLIGIVLAVLDRYPWQRVGTRRKVALFVAAVGIFGALTNVLAVTRVLPT